MLRVPKEIIERGISLENILYHHSRTKSKDCEIQEIIYPEQGFRKDSVLIKLVIFKPGMVHERKVVIEISRSRIREKKLNSLLFGLIDEDGFKKTQSSE